MDKISRLFGGPDGVTNIESALERMAEQDLRGTLGMRRDEELERTEGYHEFVERQRRHREGGRRRRY